MHSASLSSDHEGGRQGHDFSLDGSATHSTTLLTVSNSLDNSEEIPLEGLRIVSKIVVVTLLRALLLQHVILAVGAIVFWACVCLTASPEAISSFKGHLTVSARDISGAQALVNWNFSRQFHLMTLRTVSLLILLYSFAIEMRLTKSSFDFFSESFSV
jgi:hypothetical protein